MALKFMKFEWFSQGNCLFFAMLLLAAVVSGERSISLGGKWKVRNSNGSIAINGDVPGDIYSDMEASGKIGDPYFGTNDVLYRWISYDNWTYYRTFAVNEDFKKSNSQVELLLEGIDTVAKIEINGAPVGYTNNMFVRYRFPVDNLIAGLNTINVTFTSPVKYAAAKAAAHVAYDIGPDCPNKVNNGECHRNYIRKEQASFSWDWGPAFPTVGIWKPISVVTYRTAVIEAVTVTVSPDSTHPNDWHLNISVVLHCQQYSDAKGVLTIFVHELNISFSRHINIDPSGETVITTLLSVPMSKNVSRWWPNGYGSQKLYTMNVSFAAEGEMSTKLLNIAFRTVSLVQKAIGSAGLSFYFLINDIPIFLKGSNWIPADSFQKKVTKEKLYYLLESATAVHMNAMRVWGGGIYEQDDLYDIADQLGIFIWQDFMFACSLYPGASDREFYATAATEVLHQIRRLQHHPSILIWSGNNENSFSINGKRKSPHWMDYKNDYISLYVDLIRKVVLELDPGRPFVVSSPSNGLKTEQDGWISPKPGDVSYGDVHFYNYVADNWNWTVFPLARFVSEYGYQSWPSFSTIANVSNENDWTFLSDFMNHRQHHPLGQAELISGISQHFSIPKTGDSKKDFMLMLYLSQIYQAIGIKTETEFYRRSRNTLDSEGKGQTMGALYWQLNDIWQGASWSSIEYGGKWKMLHYFALNCFAPVLVSPFEVGAMLQVTAVSDLTQVVEKDVALKVSVYRWDTFQEQAHVLLSVPKIAPLSAKNIYNVPTSQLLKLANCTRIESFLLLNLTWQADDGYQQHASNFLFLSSFNQVPNLRDPNLKIAEVRKITNLEFSVTVITQAPAALVWLDAGNVMGRFSDNGFLMIAPHKIITFYARQEIRENDLAKALSVISVKDTMS